MNLTLRIWRQKNSDTPGQFVEYKADDISPDMSFLEMLDIVNEGLIKRGEEPIAFDHDCREGICGTCGMVINGVAHGPLGATTTCQLHMRHFRDGQSITIEPWRARPFPVIKDLVVDRSAFDQAFIHHVEHLQKRHVRRDVVGFVLHELPRGVAVLLAPNA